MGTLPQLSSKAEKLQAAANYTSRFLCAHYGYFGERYLEEIRART